MANFPTGFTDLAMRPEEIRMAVQEFVRDKYESTLFRQHIAYSMLEKRGRIVKNYRKFQKKWAIEYDEPKVVAIRPGSPIAFNQTTNMIDLDVPLNQRCGIPLSFDKYTEHMAGGGNLPFVDAETKIHQAMESFKRQISQMLWLDGNLAANASFFHGTPTLFTAATATTALDRLVRTGGTYGGRSMVLATEGGAWPASADTRIANAPYTNLNFNGAADLAGNCWPYTPDGQYGPKAADFMTPLWINDSSTGWGATAGWEANAIKILTWTHTAQMKRGAGVPAPGLNPEMTIGEGLPMRPYFCLGALKYQALENSLLAGRRDTVLSAQMRDLGFNGLSLSGFDILLDPECPDNDGYFISPEKMELILQWPDAIKVDGPQSVLDTGKSNMLLETWGQTLFSPRYNAKISSVA